MEEKLLTAMDLRVLFHLSRSGLDLWQRKGKLPEAVRIGHRRLWRESDILAMLNLDIADKKEGTATPAPAPAADTDIITYSEVLTITGWTASQLEQKIAYNLFPAATTRKDDQPAWHRCDIADTLDKINKE